jgi:DNA-binding winged helix-turn-helix (wHTH) protein
MDFSRLGNMPPISASSAATPHGAAGRHWRGPTGRREDRDGGAGRDGVASPAAGASSAAEEAPHGPPGAAAALSALAATAVAGASPVATSAIAVDVLRLDVVVPGLEEYELFAVRRRGVPLLSPAVDEPAHLYRVGAIEIDLHAEVVRRNGLSVALPPKCFAVLATLAVRQGRVVSRPELVREVWTESWVQSRVVDTAIWQLRKSLEDDPLHPRCIVTVKKSGYRLAEPDAVLTGPATR